MSNPIGDDAQSARDEEDREGESLCLKIKAQLEDLLSDSHLAEHGFLLKHVQKTKQGYVSLKLLTCLNKIKATDWHMTLAAAERSELLEVNDECTKVRRVKPLPKWLQCSPTSKFLLALNISAEKTVEEDTEAQGLLKRILQKFSAHGTIASVWILHPGKELPKELQRYAKCHKELGQQLCAVMQFKHLEEIRKAYNALRAEEEKSNGEGMCVVPLGSPAMHHATKDEPSGENNEDQTADKPSQENSLETSEDSVCEEPSVQVSEKIPDASQPQEFLDNSMQRASTRWNTQSFSIFNQDYSKRNLCSGDCDEQNCPSPWVLRRKLAASALNKVARRSNTPYLMQIVVRQPFGPDGTRGFRSRRKLLQQEELQLPHGSSDTTCAE